MVEEKKAFIIVRPVIVRLYRGNELVQEYEINEGEVNRETGILKGMGWDVKISR
jgi:hypothetical protein